MSSLKLLGLLIVAVVIIAGGWYVWSGVEIQPGTTSEEVVPLSEGEEEGLFKGSLTDLSERGGEWKCVVKNDAQTGVGVVASEGVVYVSGEKVRADFTSTVPGVGPVEAHTIVDDTMVYVWSSMAPQGIKASATTYAGSGEGGMSGAYGNAQQSYAYDCEPFAAEAVLFVAPTDISFTQI